MVRFLFIAASCFLGTCLRAQADDYTDLLRSAAAYTQHADYNTAIDKYRAALRLRPGAPEALNNLAVAYYQAKRYPEAYSTVAGIWQTHPELTSAALIAGLSAVRCDRPQDAVAPLEHLLAEQPRNRDALLALASARYALHDYPRAVAVYRAETGFNPSDALAWYGLAVCLEGMAEDASRKLASMPGGAGSSKRLLGEYLQSTGDKRLAEEVFGEAAAEAGISPPAAAVRQYDLARKIAGQSKDAFEHFITLAPDSWQAAVFYGDVARQHGDLPTALTQYQRAADAHPDSPAPDLGLGTVYWEMGDFDKAAAHLNATLKRNPQAMQAVFELANIAVRRHREAEAIPLLQRYLSAQPDALAAHADLGRAYLHLGNYQDAAVELQRAAASDEQGDIHYQLSAALRKLGRLPEAEAALEQSTAIRKQRALRDQRLHNQTQ